MQFAGRLEATANIAVRCTLVPRRHATIDAIRPSPDAR